MRQTNSDWSRSETVLGNDARRISHYLLTTLLLLLVRWGSCGTQNNDVIENRRWSDRRTPTLDGDLSNPQEIYRVPCTPGHVFEINNQAHHAVSNCSPKEHRVHLILDYVELTSRHDRFPLQPGKVLVQTRRSIDRQVADYGKRPTPTFLILGAQKAGTTSLYSYMMQHPLVIPAKRRETHNLDWRWNYNLNTTKKQLQHALQFYHYQELQRHVSCLTGDSTPSYLLDAPRVIQHLKQVYSYWQDMKFFVLTRNSVDALQIQTWLQHFDAKQFMILNLEDLQDTQETMRRVWKHLELPNYEIQNAKAQSQRSYDALQLLSEEMKDVLERFYQPHNARLQELSKLDNESHK